MRYRWVQIDGQLVPADEVTSREDHGPFVQGALEPFVSMADGKTYTSRYAYEAEVRARGYEIVGNDIAAMTRQQSTDFDAQGRKDLIRAQIAEMGHEGFKKALKRDVDFVKWNSRGVPR